MALGHELNEEQSPRLLTRSRPRLLKVPKGFWSPPLSAMLLQPTLRRLRSSRIEPAGKKKRGSSYRRSDVIRYPASGKVLRPAPPRFDRPRRWLHPGFTGHWACWKDQFQLARDFFRC